jgi:alkaline phosphatase D
MNARHRGYVVCEVTAAEWIASFRMVDTVKEPTSDIRTDAVFRIAAGRPGATRV